MNQHDQMREAFREALEMLQHFRRHVDIDETTYSELVATCDKLEQALAAERAPLARLTDDELNEIAGRVNKTWLANSPRSEIVPLLAAAISGALEAKNGGK